MAAKESEVSKLHNLLTKKYLEILENGEEVSPQMLAQITKFLKDNDITSDPDENPELAEVKQKAQDAIDYPFEVEGVSSPLELVNKQ